MNKLNTYRSGPDDTGHFGIFGGRYVAETLMPLILQVEKAYDAAKNDPKFWEEFHYQMKLQKHLHVPNQYLHHQAYRMNLKQMILKNLQ